MLYNQNNLNVAKIASRNETQPERAGVFFTKDKTVATDGYRLLEVSVNTGVSAEDFPKMPDGKTAMQGVKPFIVPASDLKSVKILSKNNPIAVLNYLAVSHLDDKTATFISTNLETVDVKNLRRVEGKFPDYEKVFPITKPVIEIVLDAGMLAELLEIMGKLAKPVKFAVYGNEQPVVLTCGTADQKMRGMIMPIRE